MRLLIFAILFFLLYQIVKKVITASRMIDRTADGNVIDEMVQDPVCKTYVPRRDAQRRVLGGEEYFFCSPECAARFESELKK